MKIVIWSKNNCLHCEQAKHLMLVKNLDYEERKIGLEWTTEQLLALVPNARTVPQIFIDDILVGGFEELKNYLDEHNED